MTIKLDRRQFLMGSTALIAAGAVARPAWAQDNSLRLIFWGGQARADRTYGVTDLYTQTNGGTVEGEFLAWNDYWPKLATQTAGGNAPDIIQMDYRFIVEYATRGAIAPLDEYVGGVLDLSNFDEDQLEGGKVNGKLYGISLGANTVSTLVNLTAFEEAGIEPPTSDWTYDDVRAIGEAFKAANIRGGMKAIMDASYLEPALDNWLRQRGKSLYTAEGKLGFEAADMTEWFAMWQEFREAGYCVSPDDQALDTGPLESTMLVTGKAALMQANSNQLVGYQALMQDKLGMVGHPRIAAGTGGGHYRKPSMFFSVGGSAANKQEAAALINFFINDPEAGKILGVERGIPASAPLREVVAPTLDEANKIALDFVANLGDLLGPLPPPPPAAAGEIDISLLRTVGQEVGFGARSPEDGANYFVTEAAAVLERAA